jgi:hypothetical protein
MVTFLNGGKTTVKKPLVVHPEFSRFTKYFVIILPVFHRLTTKKLGQGQKDLQYFDAATLRSPNGDEVSDH